jgi:predicted XRE-type DNA-binding protein
MLILHRSLHILVAHGSHDGSQVSGSLQNPGAIIMPPTTQDKIFGKPSFDSGFAKSLRHCGEVRGTGEANRENLGLNKMNYSKQERITMKKHGYVEGTGNVYADLGVVNPQEARAKADLAHRIIDIIEARKLTQVQAGKVLGVDQPKVSALKRGRLTDVSIGRLVGFLLLLDHNVQITVTPQPHSSRKPPTLEVNAMGAVAAARR